MIKSIFVPLQGLPRDSEALTAALGIARQFEASIDCHHVRPDPRILVASATAGMETGMGAGVFPAELWNVLVEADQRRAKAARDHFTAFCTKHGVAAELHDKGLSAGFREIEGDAARDLTRNARYSDLVVFAHSSILSDTSWDAAGDIIVGCGKPILLAPVKADMSSLATVSIAWKETPEAARVVTAAIPLLAKAGAIAVLAAHEGSGTKDAPLHAAERLAVLLRRHGFRAHAELVSTEPGKVPDAIVERALVLKSNLLVMGAYGHSRMREFVFGGFTRHILAEARLPVLIAH